MERSMKDKIIEYLGEYYNKESVKESVEKFGKKNTIVAGIKMMREELGIQEEYIRKEISVYIGRIVSIAEFKDIVEWGLVPC